MPPLRRRHSQREVTTPYRAPVLLFLLWRSSPFAVAGDGAGRAAARASSGGRWSPTTRVFSVNVESASNGVGRRPSAPPSRPGDPYTHLLPSERSRPSLTMQMQ